MVSRFGFLLHDDSFAPRGTRQCRGVPMRAVDRGVERHRPIDVSRGICLHEQRSEDVTLALLHGLPRPELHRQIAPGNPGAIALHDALDNLAMVAERTALSAQRWTEPGVRSAPIGRA
ncbi:hypothetical protein CTKZ_08480 [Cellulomonas algicola]|uniref:Uncharacterized protein n=1 Tax=Cellulomonas algicola TaxID=2071633 RepID=A0A401UX69_9CELL|nr:hypothetical protein CTKZ_08480 [Cellulomonas algicola]